MTRQLHAAARASVKQRDLRDTPLYMEAAALYRCIRQPGTGQVSDATEVQASPVDQRVVFAGVMVDKLEGIPPTRIWSMDLVTGDTRVMSFGPNTDRLPKFSPDARQIAFLSDRAREGDFQLYLLDLGSGATRATPPVEGWIEYLHWSADGKRILLGAAGHGADIAGGQGAVSSRPLDEALPSWMPRIGTGDESFRWRRVWVHELTTNTVRQLDVPDLNIWEAVWCGSDMMAAVASSGPGEGLWYGARLYLVDVRSGVSREIYTPKDQLGWLNASPSGKHIAVVEAVCSDRWIVAGDLLLIESSSGRLRRVDTRDVDITYTEWRSESALLLAGHRGFETVIGVYDIHHGTFTERWASREITTGGRYAAVSGLNDLGDCVLVGEGFLRSPELALIRDGRYQTARRFDVGYEECARSIHSAECVSWRAPDGLEIQGWLLQPKDGQPHPLILNIHGGPVWHWRPAWLGRAGMPLLMLVKRGYAVFLPNPRGSTGRGQDFARHVLGDMGGAETTDHLSGLDHLIARGIVDPKRIGVMGGSHGGFMASWLITQDTRFAAAVPVAPITNWVSEHLVTNIPQLCALCLSDHYRNGSGAYFERSPIMHAHKARTPTLNICGALDQCTPPGEAVQFHNALLENGVTSVLVTYPEEGHGVRKWPAAIDYTARVVGWFEDHIPTQSS